MTTFQDYKDETKGKALVSYYKSSTVNYEDYWINGHYVRYTWINGEEYVERNIMEVDDEES